MASPVTAGLGVVSTVASVSSQGKQARIQREQAKVDKYAAEVQYEVQRQELERQKEYSRQQQALQRTAYDVQDVQARMQLKEQELQGLVQNAQQVFANKQQAQQSQVAFNEAMTNADRSEYSTREQARNRDTQAYGVSQQANEQVLGRLNELTQALVAGDRQKASSLAMNSAMGQQDSRTGSLLSEDTQALVTSLMERAQAGRFTEDDIQQLTYNTELTGLIETLGLIDVEQQRNVATNAQDYASKVTDLNARNLDYAQQQSALGMSQAYDTLTGSTALRNQQMDIDRTFNDFGYTTQANNLSVSQAAATSSADTRRASNVGNGLLSALAVGSSLFSAAAPYLYKQWTPPTPRTSPIKQGVDVKPSYDPYG